MKPTTYIYTHIYTHTCGNPRRLFVCTYRSEYHTAFKDEFRQNLRSHQLESVIFIFVIHRHHDADTAVSRDILEVSHLTFDRVSSLIVFLAVTPIPRNFVVWVILVRLGYLPLGKNKRILAVQPE